MGVKTGLGSDNFRSDSIFMCNIFVLVHIVTGEIVLSIYFVLFVGAFDVEGQCWSLMEKKEYI